MSCSPSESMARCGEETVDSIERRSDLSGRARTLAPHSTSATHVPGGNATCQYFLASHRLELRLVSAVRGGRLRTSQRARRHADPPIGRSGRNLIGASGAPVHRATRAVPEPGRHARGDRLCPGTDPRRKGAVDAAAKRSRLFAHAGPERGRILGARTRSQGRSTARRGLCGEARPSRNRRE